MRDQTPALNTDAMWNNLMDTVTGRNAGYAPGKGSATPDPIRDRMLDGVGEVERFSDVFPSVFRDEKIIIPNVTAMEITYTKRSKEARIELRRKFENKHRKEFMLEFAKLGDEKLKSYGFTNGDILRIKDGLSPKGYVVHHKLPLDDGGDNSMDNLILIKEEPDHKIFTSYQIRATKGLKSGDSADIKWPMPAGKFYANK